MPQASLLPAPARYVLDANVFMTAYHSYYSPGICQGFWDCLEHYCLEGSVLSIDRVRAEILGPPGLVEWRNQAPGGMFAPSGEPEIADRFSRMQAWVRARDQFLPAAKDEFARVADGWLAAYAKVHDVVVVTQEVFNPDIRKKVPLPNVCREFDVPYVSTFDMLNDLDVHFDWRQPP